MDLFSEIPDPTDFSIDSLRKLDSSLRCPICKEFFDGPVVLHCGHTFCSLCIRNTIPTKPECPTCRLATKESHLVRNAMLEEAVSQWSDARALVLKVSNQSVLPPSAPPMTTSKGKRKLSDNLEQTLAPRATPPKLPRRWRSDRRDVQLEAEESTEEFEQPQKGQCRSEGDVVPSSDPEEEEFPNPERTNPPVECPLCLRQVPYNSINVHMDNGCNNFRSDGPSAKRDSKAAWGSIFSGPGKNASGSSSVQDSEIPTIKIAKVSYGVLTLSGLRKLLGEKGLPTNGDKNELITRHERWIAIFNANLDRIQPRTVGELKRKLKEIEEVGSRPCVNKIQDDKAWTRKNKAQFDSLIETARLKSRHPGEGKAVSPLSPRPQPTASGSSIDDIGFSEADVIVIE